MIIAGYILLGSVIGAISGLIGIGGGVLIVPALIFFYGLNQYQAQGTTLALLVLPTGLLATYIYHKSGYVNIPVVLFLAIGFTVGGLIGAKYAVTLPEDILRKIFGVVMFVIAFYMIFKK